TPNDEPAPGPTRADTFNPEEVINLAQEEFDEYGAELEPGARVWKTYVREADKFDLDQVDGWNRRSCRFTWCNRRPYSRQYVLRT
ncbi:hypothetical protein V565_024260, partial [Rhizoctonia solani 123E]